MSKIAFLFPGQGAQVVGMGQDLAAQSPLAQQWFERANTALGYDLAGICFYGPESELTKTEHAQPGVFLVSWVAMQLLKEHLPLLRNHATAGLSLGEFTALTAAGALSFEDGLRVVRQRGRFMQEACDAIRGGHGCGHRTRRNPSFRALPRLKTDEVPWTWKAGETKVHAFTVVGVREFEAEAIGFAFVVAREGQGRGGDSLHCRWLENSGDGDGLKMAEGGWQSWGS